MASLRKNIGSQNIGFCVNARTDGSPITTTIVGNIVIDGGAQAAVGGTFVHKGGGQWNYAPTQAETNGTEISFAFGSATAIQVGMLFYTDNWDTTQPVLTSGTGANQIGVDGAGNASTNVKQINAVATSSVTTVNANQGTTQPLNFTGTGASALVKSDVTDIAGAAVATGSAQIGVNLVNIAGSAVSATSAQLGVNVVNWNNTIVAPPATAGIPEVNVANIRGTASAGAAGSVSIDWAHVVNSSTAVNLSATTVNLVNTLTTYTGNTPQSGDVFAQLPTRFSSLLIDVGGNVSTTSNIKKNQALPKFEFLMTDSTNHNPSTGLAVTATRSLDGAAFGSCANTVGEISSGIYFINLAASDLNANVVTLRFTAAASDDQDISIVTQP